MTKGIDIYIQARKKAGHDESKIYRCADAFGKKWEIKKEPKEWDELFDEIKKAVLSVPLEHNSKKNWLSSGDGKITCTDMELSSYDNSLDRLLRIENSSSTTQTRVINFSFSPGTSYIGMRTGEIPEDIEDEYVNTTTFILSKTP